MLTQEQAARLEDFLKPPRIAIVATVSPTGMPQLTPNWYVYTDGMLAVSTTMERAKYRNLSRDSRLAICVYSEPLAVEYATVQGRAKIIDDESIWPITQVIVERYVAPNRVDARMRQLRSENRVILSLKPERVVFRT